MRSFMALIILALPIICRADPNKEIQIKNSFLTLSAFECSAVAPNDKEAERLFMLGLTAGREFIAYAQSHSDSYAKELHPHVAILWNLTNGPSPDFILGQLYADRVDNIYKEKDPLSDEALWKIKKENIYRDKNCALLGK